MHYFNNHKETGLILAVFIILLIAGFDILRQQHEASRFTKAGASLLPSHKSGGAGRCNIPTYEEYYGTPLSKTKQ
ncbi:hypothetical protein [Fodinibius sediminis]|uniref:Uncharacterized protein n=1 Tax=Fodinibius sediminis TaxID=1214077 RepID=A0A521B7U4_9BACT|nr:hypothetical protein [Fodinibius sediminis]SMO43164.1 hypothetical protein SAMN06265218_102276 [Fodinibius sediminis]